MNCVSSVLRNPLIEQSRSIVSSTQGRYCCFLRSSFNEMMYAENTHHVSSFLSLSLSPFLRLDTRAYKKKTDYSFHVSDHHRRVISDD